MTISIRYQGFVSLFEKLYKDSLETLRKYQKDAFEFRLKHANDNVVIQMPTGTGKSVLIKTEILHNLSNNNKVLVLAPSSELVQNISKYLPEFSTMAYSGVSPDENKPVLVTTFQSALKYLKTYRPDVIIIDEAHHVSTDTQLDRVLQSHKVVCTGYTATPNRLDGIGLNRWFSYMWNAPSIHWFISNGYLSDYRLYVKNVLENFSASTDDLGSQSARMIPKLDDVFKHWKSIAGNRQTIVFCATIDHCNQMQKVFKSNGITANVVTGSTHQTTRKMSFQRFREGKTQVLINVGVFTEGIDVPSASCVMLCRFTYSTPLYLQMVGRVLRPSNETAIILDYVNNSFYHGQITDPFYWDLNDREKRVSKTNAESNLAQCFSCESKLFPKSILKRLENDISVCCMECSSVNHFKATKKASKLGSVFDVDELKEINKESLEPFIARSMTRFKSAKSNSDRLRIVSEIFQLEISDALKRSILSKIGFDEKSLDIYFD